MVQLTYPGVYIREVPSGARTITGVATSIAAFVGMAKNGPLTVPTLVLGFRDYTRIFSDDTSQGEMTDQVRQFFLNGGSQAYIVRIAEGANESSVVLTGANGATLTLTARSAGLLGDFLRVSVDYDTANPESLFNLTVFRERTDPSGNVTVVETETHSNLSMDPAAVRFVGNVIQNGSALVAAEVALASPARNGSYSISAALRSDATALATFLFDSFPAAPGEVRRFQVRVGTQTSLIAISQGDIGPNDAGIFGRLADRIETLMGLPANTITCEAVSLGTGAFAIRFSAQDPTGPTPLDIAFDRAPDTSDVALTLGLGVAQGGIERGVYADSRPPTSSFVSAVSSPGDTFPSLLAAFGILQKGTIVEPDGDGANTAFELTGVFPIPPVLGSDITLPSEADLTDSLFEGTVVAGPSLLNLRENLDAIVSAIASKTSDWVVSRSGYRIALRLRQRAAADGGAHSWSVPAAGDAHLPFAAMFAATSATTGTKFTGGLDGTKPTLARYREAYEELARVDLFNILMLPKSAGDLAVPGDRAAFWGEASSFAQSERAILLIDAQNTVDTVLEVRDKVVDLRVGIVKDHSAFYWPRLRIDPDNNPRHIDASGTIAGIMSRIDSTRGVWKAPAGLEADLRAVLGVEVPMSDPENGLINPRAVNAVRAFTNGIVSWGARTMDGFDESGNNDYKYVPVRRFSLFLEESIFRGLKFAVFEPNDEPLWGQIRLAVGAFLNNLFRLGAFAGRSSRDSYFVKCDAETTTQNDINLGIVNVVVGFAPLKPAEFIVVTIQQKAGQVQV